MRIGFDAKRAFKNKTGLGNYSRTIINALDRLYPDNDYLLYTTDIDDSVKYIPPKAAEVCLPGKIWSNGLKSYWRTYRLPQRLQNDKVDLYHGLSNEIPAAIHKTGIPSVVTIHDLIFMRLPNLYPPIDRRIYYKKVRNAVLHSNRIIAISQQTRDDLVELFNTDPAKIDIVYQGCNPWFYDPASEEQLIQTKRKYQLPDRYLLYVGTIEERKDLLTIIKAMHLGDIKIPLVAVGRKTAFYEKVNAYMIKHGITNVHFHHHIDNADLPAVYQQAEVFIYPSRYEGFGIPVLEAINSSIPVITTKGGCLEESAGPGGLFIEPGNAEQLAEHIGEITTNRDKRAKLIALGKDHALKFREASTIPQLYNVYLNCMK